MNDRDGWTGGRASRLVAGLCLVVGTLFVASPASAFCYGDVLSQSVTGPPSAACVYLEVFAQCSGTLLARNACNVPVRVEEVNPNSSTTATVDGGGLTLAPGEEGTFSLRNGVLKGHVTTEVTVQLGDGAINVLQVEYEIDAAQGDESGDGCGLSPRSPRLPWWDLALAALGIAAWRRARG
jgi:hypothetical protein